MTDPFEYFVEVFSIQKTDSFWLWVELVTYIAHARARGVTGPVAARALKAVAKKHNMYFLHADARMKYAIKPLIEADEEALNYVGLHPTKRTACGLAEAAAELYIKWLHDVEADARRRYAEAQENAREGDN